MRLVFFTHYFPPEGNAPATRTWEHCTKWAQQGCEITVITSVPNVPNGVVYQGYRNRIWPQVEMLDGIRVIRIWTYLAPNAGGVRRILNYLSYMMSALFTFMFWCRRPEVIIATSPQFFCGWAGVVASYMKWTKLVVEIRDIWPESIIAVGAMKRSVVTKFLELLENWMYVSADRLVAVTHGLKQSIIKCAPSTESRISVITNGVDLDIFVPKEKDPALLTEFGLAKKFVCSYVGTIGMAHGLSVVVRAAELLRESGRDDAGFLIVGDGADRQHLEDEVKKLGLEDYVRFPGRIEKSRVSDVLASSDVVLIHLRKFDLFKSAIPSKLFESMAMNKPMLVGVQGEAEEIIRESKSGLLFEPENSKQLAELIMQLESNPNQLSELAKHGRKFVAENYSRDIQANRMLEVIQELGKRP